MNPTEEGLGSETDSLWLENYGQILKKAVIVVIFLTILALFSMRPLMKEGLVGFGWDWDIPPFAEQIKERAAYYQSSWDYTTLGQPVFLYQGANAYFWLTIQSFSFLGSDFISKAAPIFVLVLSGISMYVLCRVLKLGFMASLTGAVFYMFSPLTFSAITAGHLALLFGYAFTPITPALLIESWNTKNIFRSNFFTAIAGATMALSISQIGRLPQLILILVIIAFAHNRVPFKKVLKSLLSIFFIAVLLHSFWILPFATESLAQGSLNIPLGKFSGGKLSEESVLLLIQNIRQLSNEPLNSLRLLADRDGMNYEFFYPINHISSPLWIFSSFAIPFLAFFSLIVVRDTRLFSFGILAVIGILLTSIGNNPLILLLEKLAPVAMGISIAVLSELRNPYRLTMITAISYSVLLAATANYLIVKVVTVFGSRKSRVKLCIANLAPFILLIILYTSIIVYTSPYTYGRISDKVFVSAVYKNAEDAYMFLRSDPEEHTIAFLPPESYSWFKDKSIKGPAPDLTITWAAKPILTGQVINLPWVFPKFVASGFLQENPNSDSYGSIMGLSSTKYIIMQGYRTLYPQVAPARLSFGTGSEKSVSNDNILRNVAVQKDIIEVPVSSNPDLKVYMNKAFLPRLRPVEELAIATGDISDILSFVTIPAINFTKMAIIYPAQLEKNNLGILNETQNLIILNDNYFDFAQMMFSRDNIIYPGEYVSRQNDPDAGWANLNYGLLLIDPHLAGPLQPEHGIFTITNATISLPFKIQHTGNYKILAKIHFGIEGAPLIFQVDRSVVKEFDTRYIADIGFKWVDVGSINMSTGDYHIDITSAGPNAVMGLIVTPEETLKEMLDRVDQLSSNKRVILIYEFINATSIIHDPRFSNGFGVPLPAKGKVYVPSEGEYKLSLRLLSKRQIPITFSMDNFPVSDFEIEASSEPQWITLMKVVNLPRGDHVFSLDAREPHGEIPEVVVDQMLIERTDNAPKSATMPKDFSFHRLSPTSYEVKFSNEGQTYIIFGGGYDQNWLAITENRIVRPIIAYGFANLYIIEGGRDVSFHIEYAKQRIMNLGWSITIATWLILLLFIGFNLIRARTSGHKSK